MHGLSAGCISKKICLEGAPRVSPKLRTASPRILARARKRKEPVVVNHHDEPYALIQPITQQDLERLEWKALATRRQPHLGRRGGYALRLFIGVARSSSSVA